MFGWILSGPANTVYATHKVIHIISGDPETFRKTKANDEVSYFEWNMIHISKFKPGTVEKNS